MTSLTCRPPNTAPLHFPAAAEVGPANVQQSPPPLDAETLAAAEKSARFESELQELNMRNARLGAWFVMVLVPFCALLDWLAYPARFWEFLLLRIFCSAMCIPLMETHG